MRPKLDLNAKRSLLSARQFLLRMLRFLLAGAAATVVVAWALAVFIDTSPGIIARAGSWRGRGQWSVTRTARPGSVHVQWVVEPPIEFSPEQATGPPDTPLAGDRPTAWASQSPDGQAEWLQLEYAHPVVPAAVRIYESYGPGAVHRVSVFDQRGREVEAWSGADPAPRDQPMAVSEIALRPVGFSTTRLTLHVDCAGVPNWNEIDAVALISTDGREQWAVAAEASSTYSTGRQGLVLAGGRPEALLPDWGRLPVPEEDDAVGAPGGRQERIVQAGGWPALALWGPVVSRGAMRPPAPPLLVHPIWRGFLLDTVVYAMALYVLSWTLKLPYGVAREALRRRRGHCIMCGYDLRFDFPGGCPECGWGRESRHEPDAGRVG